MFTVGVQLQTPLTLILFMWRVAAPAGTALQPTQAPIGRSSLAVLNASVTICLDIKAAAELPAQPRSERRAGCSSLMLRPAGGTVHGGGEVLKILY